MRMAVGFLLAVVTAIAVDGAAQQLAQANRVDVEAIARLDALTRQLSFPDDDRDAQTRFYRDVQSLTGQVRSLVDEYIQAVISPSDGSERAQQRLQTLLAHRKPNPDYASLPFSRVADLAAGRSLLVAYTIVRGPHHNSATIRGFRLDPTNHFALVATAGEEFGDDFTSYNLFTRELPSLAAGELWLLAWGTAHTFNGTKMHFRMYAFDGRQFRTLWGPEDMFDAQIAFTRRGWSIEHLVRESSRGYTVRDEYELTPTGPQLAASTVIGAGPAEAGPHVRLLSHAVCRRSRGLARRRVELARSASVQNARRRLAGRVDRDCRSPATSHRDVPCLSRMRGWAESTRAASAFAEGRVFRVSSRDDGRGLSAGGRRYI